MSNYACGYGSLTCKKIRKKDFFGFLRTKQWRCEYALRQIVFFLNSGVFEPVYMFLYLFFLKKKKPQLIMSLLVPADGSVSATSLTIITALQEDQRSRAGDKSL